MLIPSDLALAWARLSCHGPDALATAGILAIRAPSPDGPGIRFISFRSDLWGFVITQLNKVPKWPSLREKHRRRVGTCVAATTR